MVNSIELTLLKGKRANTLAEIIQKKDSNLNKFLLRILLPDLKNSIETLLETYEDRNIPEKEGRSILPIGFKYKDAAQTSTKQFRKLINTSECITEFKFCGLIETETWTTHQQKFKRLSSVKHKNTLLRVIHGDVFSKARLHKTGFINDDKCERCGNIETTKHLLMDCEYTNKLWTHISSRLNPDVVTIDEQFIAGFQKDITTAQLTLHAEILTRLQKVERPTIPFSQLIHQSTRYIINREKYNSDRMKTFQEQLGSLILKQ